MSPLIVLCTVELPGLSLQHLLCFSHLLLMSVINVRSMNMCFLKIGCYITFHSVIFLLLFLLVCCVYTLDSPLDVVFFSELLPLVGQQEGHVACENVLLQSEEVFPNSR